MHCSKPAEYRLLHPLRLLLMFCRLMLQDLYDVTSMTCGLSCVHIVCQALAWACTKPCLRPRWRVALLSMSISQKSSSHVVCAIRINTSMDWSVVVHAYGDPTRTNWGLRQENSSLLRASTPAYDIISFVSPKGTCKLGIYKHACKHVSYGDKQMHLHLDMPLSASSFALVMADTLQID